MTKKLISFLMLFGFLLIGTIAAAEEYYPPPADGRGVIGGRNGEAWGTGIFTTLTASAISAGALPPTETVTAANVLTAAECGTTYYLNSATEFATTLPAVADVSAGCGFTFIVKAAASAANYTVTTGATLEDKIYGTLMVAGAVVACAAEDTITLVDGNAIGDWMSVTSDGALWYITGETLTTGKLTCSAT